ncbi:MAG: hypothetical protein WA766_13635 [Candidatus Acidiferrales bacterium]
MFEPKSDTRSTRLHNGKRIENAVLDHGHMAKQLKARGWSFDERYLSWIAPVGISRRQMDIDWEQSILASLFEKEPIKI